MDTGTRSRRVTLANGTDSQIPMAEPACQAEPNSSPQCEDSPTFFGLSPDYLLHEVKSNESP